MGLALVRQSTALVPLSTGAASSPWAVPIMGPPESTLQASSVRPPAASMTWAKGVPMRTIRFLGSFTPSPVTVTMRLVTGLPSYTAR